MATPLPVLVCPACGAPGGAFLCQRADGENLQICARCETIYRLERPASLDALYAGGAVEPPERGMEAARWRLGWLLYVCVVLGSPSTPLWDTACGYGDFLSLARGFELQPLAGSDLAPRARWLQAESGLGVHGLGWDDLRPAPGGDTAPRVIAAWDVLEHLPHPRDAVSQWASLLGAEGVLVFATPNADVVHDLPSPAQWAGFGRHFEHLHYFGEAGLNALFGAYFQTRAYGGLRQRGEEVTLGVACNRSLTLRQAQLLGSVLEEPAVLLDAIRARELGPRGLLGAALLEATAGDPVVAEEAALYAEVAGAPAGASAFVRGVVALKRNRVEAARVDLAVAAQAPRLREASQGMLVAVLERLLADAETLGEARQAAAIVAEEHRRMDEARALALEAQLAPPAPVGLRARFSRSQGPGARAGAPPLQSLQSWIQTVRQVPQKFLGRLQALRWPQWRAQTSSRALREQALLPYLGQRVVVLPTAADEGWPARWWGLGEALARQDMVVILVDEAAPVGLAPVAPGVFVCQSLDMLEDLPSPWVVAREPQHLELLGRFLWPQVIYDAPLPPVVPVVPVASPPVPAAALEPWQLARESLPVRSPARGPRNEREQAVASAEPDWTPEELMRAHEALLAGAACVVARTAGMHEAAQAVRPDALWVPDGVEPGFWRVPASTGVPSELAGVVAAQRPVAGFWGPLGAALDWELITAVAGRLPHWAFVLLGPRSGQRPTDLGPHVYVLEEPAREALPAFVACFTAVFLPLQQEVAAQGVAAPVLCAAMAAGKPVVTVSSPEAEPLRTVRVAETAEDFAVALEGARASLGLPAAAAARLREAEAHTAGVRVQPLVAALTTGEAATRDRVVILTQTPFAASGGDHRAAQFARAWLQRGWHVLYLQASTAGLAPGRRMAPPGMSLQALAEWPSPSPLTQLPRGRYVGVLTSPHPLFEPFVEALQAAGAELVYDLVEDDEAYREPHAFDHGTEARLAGLADVLTAPTLGAAAVLEARCGRTVYPLPDGVDRTVFDRKRVRPRPKDLPSGRPVLLYAGALWDSVFNWRILQAVLEAYPSATVVLVGEYADQCPYAVPAHLHILGSRSRSSLAAYLQAADVVLLPLVFSPGQQSPRPSEVLAALALAKPVVTTAYGEHVDWPGLYIAPDATRFVAAIAQALDKTVDTAMADALVRVNSWEQRLDDLLALVFPPLLPLADDVPSPLEAVVPPVETSPPALEAVVPPVETSPPAPEALVPPEEELPSPSEDRPNAHSP